MQLGGGQQSSPGAQIELGHQLARNPKLKRMAQLVGRMRESARALRRTLYERANDEMYAVGLGAELSRLLPPELLSLRHPVLRRDFARRLLDGELLVYALRAREQKGRGPMIVCLDGSSSMAGDKEIWSKAVTLTLLDIARRQRRRFRSICFSSADTPLQVLDLNAAPALRRRTCRRSSRWPSTFPAAAPTSRSRSTPRSSACAARPPPPRRHRLHHRRRMPRRSRVAARVQAREGRASASRSSRCSSTSAPARSAPLKDFSDHITSVRQLTSDATREIFLKV